MSDEDISQLAQLANPGPKDRELLLAHPQIRVIRVVAPLEQRNLA